MKAHIHPLIYATPQPGRDLELAYQMFLTAKRVEQVTARTFANYEQYLRPFIAWLHGQGVEDAGAVTVFHIRTYLAEIEARPGKEGHEHVAPYTVHSHAKHIRTWLRWLFDEELIAADPTARLKMPRLPNELLPVFTVDDVKKILDAAETARDKAIVLLMLDTGLRAAEVCKLTVADVDLATGDVRVIEGKGKKDRTAFLGNRARMAVQRYLKGRRDEGPEPLFPNDRLGRGGGFLTPNGLLQLCTRLGERAGVEHCHPHTFRRTFATMALDNEINLSAL